MSESISRDESLNLSPAPRRSSLVSQKVVVALSIILALQMTSYVMILPLFARRFNDFGAGVKALGISAMAFAITSTLAAPFMGALADRFGRKPLILGSLAAYIVAFCGYLLAPSAGVIIALRGFAGAFTAGLMPAVTGLATDLAPEDRRAQWISFVSGGAAFGWVVGPIAGGVVYDRWGYSVALIISIVTAIITFLISLLAIPNIKLAIPHSFMGPNRNEIKAQPKSIQVYLGNLRSTLPESLSAFSVLLFLFFAVLFAWAFIDSEFYFYTYNDLDWSSSMLGLAMGTYGAAMMLGEFTLGRLSDRLGRKPVILIGLVLFSAQFFGLAFFKNYFLITVTFAIAGLGNAIYDPALSASLLDISPVAHRARILGIRYTAGSLGSILGPMLFVMVTTLLSPAGVFLIAAGIVLSGIVAASTIKTGKQPSRIDLDPKVMDIKNTIPQMIDGRE